MRLRTAGPFYGNKITFCPLFVYFPYINRKQSITPIRQGDAFICAEECYDLPRSLARHDQLVRQESNTYQEPRPHFGVVNRQHSAPDEVDGGTEYDVPRPHLTRVQHVRTLSVDSRYADVPA